MTDVSPPADQAGDQPDRSEPHLPIVAVFDFDHTLTRSDSFLVFLKMVAGPLGLCWGLLRLSPVLMRYALKLIPNWQAKAKVLKYFLQGMSADKLQQLGDRCAVQSIPKILRSEAIERLKWHQAQGHQVAIVSASLETYLKPWAGTMGIEQVAGTQLEVVDGVVTGQMASPNCYGPEKVVRLAGLLGNLDQYCLYAYGDSRGDRELLAAARYPYYRRFDDNTPDASLGPTLSEVESADRDLEQPAADAAPVPHWERGLILSVVAAAALYLGFAVWSGADQIWAGLKLLPPWLIPALLGLIFIGYCLRFVRWQWYLAHLGYQVPVGSSFQIFLASFALTASPGKAGESVKSLLLKRRHGVPIAPTLAALFCERFTDALSVVLLIMLSLFSAFEGLWAVLLVGAAQILVILLLQRPDWVKGLFLKPLARVERLRAIVHKLEAMVDSASTLLKPKLLLGSTLLAFLAWGFEGVALYLIFQFLGSTDIAIYQAVVVHTGSGLLGALTFLPGGIGSTEVLTIGLSVLYGATRTAAVTATLLIRLMTLWFAVMVGMVAMLSLRR